MTIIRDFIAVLSGFRKFSIMTLLLITAIVFRSIDLVSGQEFVDLLKNTTIAFFSFNGIEHMTGAIKEWIKNKTGK